MSKPESLSARAKGAKSIADLWGLFFTPTMLDKIVLYTNHKIQEDLERKQYTPAQCRKRPHLKSIDIVSFPLLTLVANTWFSSPMFYLILLIGTRYLLNIILLYLVVLLPFQP
jgi:hypothetical protein